jgi:hypothetical protein
MVKSRILIAVLAVVFVLLTLLNCGLAQTRQYHLGQEWVKIWIRADGSIDLFYNISITLDSGEGIHYVYVGQPNGDFKIGEAFDQYGHPLSTSDASSGSDYKVQVNLASALIAGQTVWFDVTTNVAHMIYEDNQTNVGMLFKPTWWSEASVSDLRVSVVLPLGVNASTIGVSVTSDSSQTIYRWDNLTLEPDRSWAVFWQRENLVPNQRYSFGVSFPKGYTSYETRPTGLVAFFKQYGPALLVFGVFTAFIIIFVALARKRAYLVPRISMETLGTRRGLTAVEASYLLDMKPTKIVAEILYSLLQKRAVWVESAKPSIRLRIMQPFQDKKGTRETPLRYYEIDFMNALKEDGTLDEEKLARTIMSLRDSVEEKMRGYRRKDTIDYYRQVVAKAWEQVEQAGTPELASNAYDEQLLWLFLDPNCPSRTQAAFRDRTFQPSPMWLWYWYGYQHYYPHPMYKPNVEAPAQAAKPPTIPGADFANNIATAVENTSNNIVVNVEKFANSILPFSPGKSSTEPAHHQADCVCACAACACACACVSCACACAGGGVGIIGGGVRP